MLKKSCNYETKQLLDYQTVNFNFICLIFYNWIMKKMLRTETCLYPVLMSFAVQSFITLQWNSKNKASSF